MSLTKSLTPKNTEEVKPNLFIQKYPGGYRKVNPAAWNGKINWKNFIFGERPIKNLFIFIALMLLAYGYFTGTKSCTDFQENPCMYLPNITDYCFKIETDSNLGGDLKIDGETNFNIQQVDS